MFVTLDERTNCVDVTDLILSFLPIRWVDFTIRSKNRIYRTTRGFGGLVEPTMVFRDSVWHDRLTHEDSSFGVKLTAHRRLGNNVDGEEGRPVPSRGQLLVQIFSLVKLPSHALCNSGLTRILENNGEEVSENEIAYLTSHLVNIWLPRLYEHFQEASAHSVAHTGLGEVIGEILCGTILNPAFDAVFIDAVTWVSSTLETDSGRRFHQLVLEPFRISFEQIFVKLEARTWEIDKNKNIEALETLRRSFREQVFNLNFLF